MRRGKTLKRDSLWAIGWFALFIGGLSLGAALYLALKPAEVKPAVSNKPTINPAIKPVATLLVQSRIMNLNDRESLKLLFDLLNIQIAPEVAWSLLLKPNEFGDGVIALHEHNNHYWLQLPTLDDHTQWLESDAKAERPDFLYPSKDNTHLISGHLPKSYWQQLLPATEHDSCLLWPQIQGKLPDLAVVEADTQPLTFRLSWDWPLRPNAAKQLPAHEPRKTDALFSAALTEASEHCDDNPYLLRLWPNAKRKPQLAVLQQNNTPIESPLQELALPMHVVQNVSGALSSSNEADKWLSTLQPPNDTSLLLFRNYVNTARMASLTNTTTDFKTSIDVQVWWQDGRITLQMQWRDE